jgi:hypothetical protein
MKPDNVILLRQLVDEILKKSTQKKNTQFGLLDM